ncbi:MAG: alpha/beta fold hydrolase [Burkholderiales bacterium]|nr:MAG: alpha/beta fold hydrolase [Burkholderiales bacterium]
MADIPHSTETLTAFDGTPIQLLCWTPPAGTTPRAVVQIAHGMGEHAGRYDRVAQALLQAGYAVVANQHRGHGPLAQAAGTLGDFGPGGFTDVVRDMVTVTEWAKQRHPGVPLVLFGHSMGSFAAQLYALDHSAGLAALALSGTTATDLLLASRGTDRKLEDANKAITTARTPFDWLSRDEAEVDKYIADPLCGFTMNKPSMVSIYASCARTAEPGAFRALRPELPVYLFTGERDPVNHNLDWFHPLVRRMRDAGLRDVTVKTYPGARHEVLNEVNRGEVMANLLVWLDRISSNGYGN